MTVTPAAPSDLNAIRSIWYEDSLAWPVARALVEAMGRAEYSEVTTRQLNATLDQLGAYVVRPPGAPEDTIGAFMVADLSRDGAALVHWVESKRRWRGLGMARELFAMLDGRKVTYVRYATEAQRAGMDALGWSYRPSLAFGGEWQ